MKEGFRKMAEHASNLLGSPGVFLGALLVMLMWSISGPFFGFSQRWQPTLDTVVGAITFLIALLIQSTQNRDARAIHLKLNELLRVVEGAHPGLIGLQNLSEEDLDRLERAFHEHRNRHVPEKKQTESIIEALEQGDHPKAAEEAR